MKMKINKDLQLSIFFYFQDWELFVKSPSDSNDISQFVEKVVFNLHDSFPKPKRVIKEPPYVVKGKLNNLGFSTEVIVYVFLKCYGENIRVRKF